MAFSADKIRQGAAGQGGDYELEQSLKFNEARSPYLSRTPSSAGNRKTFTYSCWMKIGNTGNDNNIIHARESANDRFHFLMTSNYLGVSYYVGGTEKWIRTTELLRDPSAWYHIVLRVDTTQSTGTNRVRIYVNGEVQILYAGQMPTQNWDLAVNNNVEHRIGQRISNNDYKIDGYLAEIHLVDGASLAPTAFAETGDYGEWKPIEYSGTYGTNGFYLPFKQDYTVEGFSTVTWRGNGVRGNYIGGTGFKPDFTWIKERDGPYSHVLANPISGTGRFLSSASSGAESYDSTKFQNFAKDGFTVGTHAGVNSSGKTYVAWNWDMGADTPTGFSCVTYTGNGTTGQTIGGVGFQPDLVWLKNRGESNNHFLYDAVRGAKKYLQTDNTGAEATTNQMTAFNPDGFTVDEDGGSATNDDGDNFVAWCWNMGNTSVANTTGSINSTVRANTTYGQSIVSYTGNQTSGATIGHGLSSTPEMIIVKNTQSTANWAVLHKDIASDYETDYLTLNGTGTSIDNVAYWNDTKPTNAVFSVGNDNDTNKNSNPHIAYCFHSVSGYSKISNYTGNGSSTGPTVTLGFRPAFIMLKSSTQAENWNIIDNVRSPFDKYSNGADLRNVLKANSSVAESQFGIKFTDTGFQLVTTDGECNANGQTYIYMAFAGGLDSIADHNTTGTIPSYVKANPTYGQSVVSYTGTGANATVGHGLSSAPEMMFIKGRENSHPFNVYHEDIGATYFLLLNSNLAYGAAASNRWNNTAPDSTKFSLGSSANINESNKGMIAYCFHSVAGYSKIGTYVGNGGSNAITTGFEPAFLVIKRSTGGTGGWMMYDNVRGVSQQLQSNSDAAEDTVAGKISFQSTGFTCLINHTETNSSGDNYVYMAFADKREYAYWLDQSGNNNDWTSNNLTESDISLDSPTNNFATLNPLDKYGESNLDRIRFKEGNLYTYVTDTAHNRIPATMGVSSGKFYWEELIHSSSAYFWQDQQASVVALTGYKNAPNNGDGNQPGRFENNGATYHSSGTLYANDNGGSAGWGNSYTKGDIISIALDMDNGKVWFAKNGNWQASGNPATGANPAHSGMLTHADTYTAFAYLSYGDSALVFNFGQDSSFAGLKTAQGNQDGNSIGDFYYAPPTGFLALCTSNLPDVAVTPSEHFNTILFTGNGTDDRSITGVGFAPDLSWLKSRPANSGHNISDKVRGNNKILASNTTAVEATLDTIVSLDSDGFTVGDGNGYDVNKNGESIVAWNWKANGSGSANTAGSINSTVSVNTDAGFSIIKYHGTGANATVGHGLSKAPELVICKDREAANGWGVGQFQLSNTQALYLDLTIAFDTNNYWNSTSPSSTVISLGVSGATNANNEMIAYAFHSVDGYSKVGSYTGNGNADGTFVYTGFRPAFVLIKRSNSAGQGSPIFDSARDEYNTTVKRLNSNDSVAEVTTDGNIDLLSNGFKARNTDGSVNTSDGKYIYIAFAETPFKHSNAR